MQYTNKLAKCKLFEQPDLFGRAIEMASPKVKAANNEVIARIEEIAREEELRRLGQEFLERRKQNEREEDEERAIWYEILDNENMAQELAGIAEGWFLEWALAVYKDEITSDAIREAYAEHQMMYEGGVEV